jgi:hypothetical protein
MGTVGNQMYHISITNVPGEGYSINVSFAQNLISTFLFHHYDSVLVKVSRTQHNIYGALAHKKSLVSRAPYMLCWKPSLEQTPRSSYVPKHRICCVGNLH